MVSASRHHAPELLFPHHFMRDSYRRTVSRGGRLLAVIIISHHRSTLHFQQFIPCERSVTFPSNRFPGVC